MTDEAVEGHRGRKNGPAGRNYVLWAVLAAVLLGILAWYFWGRLGGWVDFLRGVPAQKEKFRRWIESFGLWAPLVFISVQVAQVVFSPIPGELTGFLGGYIFGVLWGTFFSTIGLTLGSYLAFFIGRALGRPFVERLITRRVLERFDFLVNRSGALLAFLFFNIPGFPKDYMCYLLGLSPLRTRVFLLVAAAGRIPGTFILGLQGASLYEERYALFMGLLIAAILIGGVIALFREAIQARLIEWFGSK